MLKENAGTFLDRSPLFPGTSCFPLSPSKSEVIKRGGYNILFIKFLIKGFPHSHTD